MKGKKVLLCVVLAIISAILFLSTDSFAAERKTLAVGYNGTNTAYTREGTRVFAYTVNSSTAISDTSAGNYAYVMTSLDGTLAGSSRSSRPLPVLKIVEKTGNSISYADAIYCLRAGQGFGSYEASNTTTFQDIVYAKSSEMSESTTRTLLGSITNSTMTQDKYKSLLWLLDNLYLPKVEDANAREQSTGYQDPENAYKTLKLLARYNYLQKMFANTGTSIDFAKCFLTDDDIEVVQQWAIWYFTNSSDTVFNKNYFPTMSLSTGNLIEYKGLSADETEVSTNLSSYGYNSNTYDGSIRQSEAEQLFYAIIDKAEAQSGYSKEATTVSLNHILNPTAKLIETGSLSQSSNYVFGPFEVLKDGDGSVNLSGEVVGISNGVERTILSSLYTLCDSEGRDIIINRQNATLVSAADIGAFYIKIDKALISQYGIDSIKLKISYTITDGDGTTATLWVPYSKNGVVLSNSEVKLEQPVVIVNRNPKTGDDEEIVTIPQFDLSLRKYITGVKRNGSNVTISELTGRTPEIDKDPLRNQTDTTAIYKHRKDPVPVQTGDIVTYVIEVFNEGDIAGRATQIIDYLPEGLTLVTNSANNSSNYSFSQSGTKITITPVASNTTNIPAYNKLTNQLSSITIQFDCEVTKTAGRGSYEILTNIAEITNAYDANGARRYLEGDDRDSIPNNLSLPSSTNLPNYKGNSSNSNLDDTNRNNYFKGQEDDDDFEKLKVTTPEFDLALRKFITKVDGVAVTDRTPNIDTTPLRDSDVNTTTALYKHKKDPITVGIGSKIEYTIRVYNEAETAGYVTIIEDYLPDGLDMVPTNESATNRAYGWYTTGTTGRIVRTSILDGTVINAYNAQTDRLDYKEVKIECYVTENVTDGQILTNIAQINGASRNDDRDSQPMNADKPTGTELENYKGYNNIDDLSRTDYYYKGKQDDDDFEKVKVYKPGFDLALRKFITHIDGTQITVSRDPNIDTTGLKNKTAETAIYKHKKDPITVAIGSVVRYRITIYNEGEENGYASKIEDYLPAELELAPNSDINTKYGWTTIATESGKSGTTIVTDYWSKAKAQARSTDTNYMINGYNSDTDTLDSRYVEVECVIKDTAPDGKILTNIAQIKEAYNSRDQKMYLVGDDRDSEPDNVVKPADTYLPDYKGNTDNKDDLTDARYFYKGQQDDDDFEKIKVYRPQYDLALRKFITAIDGKTSADRSDLLNRAPVVDVSPLKNKTATTAIYTHSKEPLSANVGDKVIYTIRIYNEGEYDGYASLIEDYLPPELELVPASESAVNTKYGWKVIATEAGKSGTTVTTDYWSIQKAQARNTDKDYSIKAFDPSTMQTLDYRDVQIECIIKDTAPDGKVLTNIAQIKNQNRPDDRDSTPDNVIKPSDQNLPDYHENQEDDDDYEKIIVYKPKFDLALRKFITHIAGNAVEESREPVVDVTPLKDKTGNAGTTAIYTHSKTPLEANVGDIIRYTIRVYNEAEVDGYVKEIEDYLPPELVLVSENDSEINRKYGWRVVATDAGFGGTTIVTDYWNKEKAESRSEDTNYIIRAFDPNSNNLDYRDVQVECKIISSAENGKILTNIAQINDDSNDDRDSTPDNVIKPSDQNLPDYHENQEDDDDYEKVIVHKPEFDLALRKFITHIEGNAVEISREPIVDVTPLKNKTATTAIYTHPKTALIVNKGDVIRYTIRVYNEAEVDGYATIIEDYLPAELELVSLEESQINRQYNWIASGNGRVITTDYWNDENSATRGEDNTIRAFDPSTMTTLDYKDVQIECRVKTTAPAGKVLTNIAQINGDSGDDRDSQPANVVKPSDDRLPSYRENQQDDDDFEKVKIYIPVYDLALRKFITKVDNQDITSRVPVVDVSPLTDNDPETTTAIYTHPKTPVLVKNGNIVVYTIRVYNEGEYDAFAEEIKDNIPEGLEFIIDNDINIEYRWRLSSDEKQVSTDYLSSARDSQNVIKAFNPSTMTTLDYKDVKIAFKVVEPNTSTRVIKNIAEIKRDDIDDIDSTPDNDVPDEDDIDEENIRLKYFDLALRKFITRVESKTGEELSIETDTTKDVSREPQVEIDANGKIKYIHPKDPVIVANSDVVIYTLRVYNEGLIDGYAEEIKDDVPVGLELVPDHAINTKYGWVMYDENGEETTDPTLAKTIRTTYLSEQNSSDNIILAFDRTTMSEPDYKDVQVAFKVVEKNVGEERIVINTAEISKDSDDDIDSTPDNDEPDEDDIDQEFIKLKYFDLSLLKWVSKVFFTENGKTTVTETGYNGLENPEPIVKLELKNSQINKVTIKYEYGIRITNEGQIPGYAKEIRDYIPDGLEFIQEDNPLWRLDTDGTIVTNQLDGTLLQPGESAVITVIFKWKNGNDNFGTKVNWAEISKDYNDKDAEDIDSTPDNNERNPKEDDIDEAYVVLNPKTGVNPVFVVLPTIVLAILATGIFLIKKYVI